MLLRNRQCTDQDDWSVVVSHQSGDESSMRMTTNRDAAEPVQVRDVGAEATGVRSRAYSDVRQLSVPVI